MIDAMFRGWGLSLRSDSGLSILDSLADSVDLASVVIFGIDGAEAE